MVPVASFFEHRNLFTSSKERESFFFSCFFFSYFFSGFLMVFLGNHFFLISFFSYFLSGGFNGFSWRKKKRQKAIGSNPPPRGPQCIFPERWTRRALERGHCGRGIDPLLIFGLLQRWCPWLPSLNTEIFLLQVKKANHVFHAFLYPQGLNPKVNPKP